MLSNTLTLKGKIRTILSQCKTIFFNILNIKRRVVLNKSWNNLKFPKKNSVIIIANGPSFNKKIAEEIILKRNFFDIAVMNNYHLNDFSKKLIPDYYVLSDPQHVETKNENQLEIINLLKNYILNSKINLLTPYDKRWEFYKKPFLQFNDAQNLRSNNIDPRNPRGYRSNTAFKAIALMLAIGYENIFILGFDYEYPRKIYVDENNNIYLKNEFSFGEQKLDLSNHFDSIAHAMHWWSEDYWHLKKLRSKKIINVTEKSMIDVFTRMKPDDFINYIKKIS